MACMMHRLDEKLEESAIRLMSADGVRFADIKPDCLQAVGFKGRYRDNIDPGYGWDWLKVFNNPMRLSEETYTPINPSGNADFRRTKILTTDWIDMHMWKLEDDLGIIAWMRGKRSWRREFSFERVHNPDGMLWTVSGESKVVPIYTGNPDFLAVMDYIEANGVD